MFKLFKAKDRTKWFQIEHWQALLEATKVMGTHTGGQSSSSVSCGLMCGASSDAVTL